MKVVFTLMIVFMLAACAGKDIPRAYMPTPPEILMRDPKQLNTIKQEEASDEKVL